MEKYIQKLVNSKLFFNMVENEIESVLNCLSANVKSYKNTFLMLEILLKI